MAAAGSRSPPVFPVIVFSHGLGGIRTSYSAIACDLASHGYVVACVEHRWVGIDSICSVHNPSPVHKYSAGMHQLV